MSDWEVKEKQLARGTTMAMLHGLCREKGGVLELECATCTFDDDDEPEGRCSRQQVQVFLSMDDVHAGLNIAQFGSETRA